MNSQASEPKTVVTCMNATHCQIHRHFWQLSHK